MSDPRFIFETVDFQNGANTINNYVDQYNANCNAAVTGNTFKFRSDYDRMKNLIGSSGQSRNSGYYDGLYVSLYAMTVTPPTLPSTIGPGSAGWGRQLWTGPITDYIGINDTYLQAKGGQTNYVGVQISGYLYSPTATTTTLQTTSDDGVLVTFNGANVISNWTYHGPAIDTSASLSVNKGYNPIRILFFEGEGGAQLDFEYKLPATASYTGNLKCNFFYNYNQM
jgi:hypothetical protein